MKPQHCFLQISTCGTRQHRRRCCQAMTSGVVDLQPPTHSRRPPPLLHRGLLWTLCRLLPFPFFPVVHGRRERQEHTYPKTGKCTCFCTPRGVPEKYVNMVKVGEQPHAIRARAAYVVMLLTNAGGDFTALASRMTTVARGPDVSPIACGTSSRKNLELWVCVRRSI